MINRREFMTRCAAGAAVCAVPGGLLAASRGNGPGAVAAEFGVSKRVYRALLGQRFRCVTAGGCAVPMRLVEVRDGPEVPGLEQFGLVLRGQHGETRLPADLYRLYHPRTGMVLVHLSPSATAERAYATQFGLFT